MKVTGRYFAAAAEAAGRDEEVIGFAPGATLGNLKHQLERFETMASVGHYEETAGRGVPGNVAHPQLDSALEHVDGGIVLIVVFAQTGAFEHPDNGLVQGLLVAAVNRVCSAPAVRLSRSMELLTCECLDRDLRHADSVWSELQAGPRAPRRAARRIAGIAALFNQLAHDAVIRRRDQSRNLRWGLGNWLLGETIVSDHTMFTFSAGSSSG